MLSGWQRSSGVFKLVRVRSAHSVASRKSIQIAVFKIFCIENAPKTDLCTIEKANGASTNQILPRNSVARGLFCSMFRV